MKKIYFTEKEQLIFYEMLKGYSNTDIAKKLVISRHTVKAHVTNIIRKLKARNRTQAVTLGLLRIFEILPQSYEYVYTHGVKNTFSKK